MVRVIWYGDGAMQFFLGAMQFFLGALLCPYLSQKNFLPDQVCVHYVAIFDTIRKYLVSVDG